MEEKEKQELFSEAQTLIKDLNCAAEKFKETMERLESITVYDEAAQFEWLISNGFVPGQKVNISTDHKKTIHNLQVVSYKVDRECGVSAVCIDLNNPDAKRKCGLMCRNLQKPKPNWSWELVSAPLNNPHASFVEETVLTAIEKTDGKTIKIEDKNNGLYAKYKVERLDGGSEPGKKHEHCKYFVLDLSHDKFAKPAIAVYAEACAEEYPQLAKDLKALVKESEAGK